MGTALAVAQGNSEVAARLEEIIIGEEAGNWATLRTDRCDSSVLRVEARQQRSWLQHRARDGGMQRLTYLMNPLLPCASPLLEGHWVLGLPDLLPALEAAAGRVDHRQTEPIDPQIGAFVAARLERRMDKELAAHGESADGAVLLAQLRILAQLQSRFRGGPLPALAAWLAARAGPVLATLRNRARRAAMEERLRTVTAAGYLGPMVQVLEDPAGRTDDAREAQEAVLGLHGIDAELARIATGSAQRAALAARIGQEVAAGFGLAALAAVLAVAAFG